MTATLSINNRWVGVSAISASEKLQHETIYFSSPLIAIVLSAALTKQPTS